MGKGLSKSACGQTVPSFEFKLSFHRHTADNQTTLRTADYDLFKYTHLSQIHQQLCINLTKWSAPYTTFSRLTLISTFAGAHTSSNRKRTPRLHPRRPHVRWRHDWLCAHWIRSQYRRWSHCWRPRMIHAAHSISPTNETPQYGLGGYRIANRQAYGVELALLASVVLAGSSLPRAIRSGKPLPWALSVLAVSGLIVYGRAYTQSGAKLA